MKKIIFATILAIAGFSFTSCEKEEIGGTAAKDMAGEWTVTFKNSVEEYLFLFEDQGAMPAENNIENWSWDYIYDDSEYVITTSNLASNSPDSLLITDDGNYWDFKVKAKANPADKTFQIGKSANLSNDSEVKIIGGKILKDAATTPSGMPADSIVFYIQFFDDSYGFTYTKVSGYRRTGFANDGH